MFSYYANEKDIVNSFAPYKIGDTVTVLKNVKYQNGILEEGTVAKIADISLLPNVDFPKIPLNKLGNYKCTSDRLFIYTLAEPQDGDPNRLVKYRDIEPDVIAEGVISSTDDMEQIYASNKKETRQEQVKLFVLFFLVCYIIVFATCSIFALPWYFNHNVLRFPNDLKLVAVAALAIEAIVSALIIHLGRYGILHGSIKRNK